MEFTQLMPLIPPLLAVILVILTRKPILSLIVSILSGLFILYGFHTTFITNTFHILTNVITSLWNIKLVLGLLILGGFIGVVEAVIKNKHIQLSKFFHSKRKVLFLGWISGLLFFIDDYFNILFNGVFLNSITKSHRISKSKLAFIIHSLGVSVCVLIPFSTWTVYIVSIINNINLNNGYGLFINSIPYNFYAISLVLITLAVILYEINILGMKKEEKEYKIIKDNSKNRETITLKQLLLPAVLLIFVSMILVSSNIVYLFVVKDLALNGVLVSLSFNDILLYAGAIGTIGLFLYYSKKGFKFNLLSKSFLFGAKQMSSAVVILFLAWVMGELSLRLNTASIIIEASKGILSNGILVGGAFIITALLSFMTSSWTTFAITIPILLPLSIAQGVNPSLVLAAIISG